MTPEQGSKKQAFLHVLSRSSLFPLRTGWLFSGKTHVMSLLSIPLKDLLLKGGAEEFVVTIEVLKNQALKPALLKV